MPIFAGIDLTCSPNKKSAYALLGDSRNIIHLESLVEVDDIIAAIERDRPDVIGIDSPLSLPSGLNACCLEEDNCSCQPTSDKKGRECERDLRQEGIWSYYTTKRSFIKGMIKRAMELSEKLKHRGFRIIEVYPYATKRRLWPEFIDKSKGSFPYKKTTLEGRKFFQALLSCIVGNMAQYPNLNHDKQDAIIAAFTAYLYDTNRTEPIGDREEGEIIIPKKNLNLCI
ncbi:MAG TPA: DUF429 domain-containing protein [Dehalococcoidia bacterium]|nr:DUF429 domain-containing protein [Dehalococcoidia bacterium]